MYSDITTFTCRDGADWQTGVVRPSHDHTPATVSTPSYMMYRCRLMSWPSLQISQLSVLECPSPALLYSTQCTLSLHPLPSPTSLLHPPPPVHILTSGGSAGSTVINCFDHTPHTVACATSAWGYHVS